MSETHLGSAPVPYTYSLRVTLSFASGKVKILNARRVAMRALGSPPTPPAEDSSGFWFEIHDEDGKLLYHRPLPHGDLDTVEVFDDPKGGTIRRVPVSNPERKIDLIIPDIPDATEFTLHGPKRPEERMKPSTVLERQPMERLRDLAQGRTGTAGNSRPGTGGTP
jgi:hypothetical protein